MQKPLDSSSSAASAETPTGHPTAPATRPGPPVATLRQYLDGPAETFEMARRQKKYAVLPNAGGAPDADGRRLFAR